MSNTDIYINIDQNLPPIIIENGDIKINFSYSSIINFSKIDLKLINIKTNDEYTLSNITPENFRINCSLGSSQIGDKSSSYKIQIIGTYNENEYCSNYGIIKIINITDYNYNINYDTIKNQYYLNYNTKLKDNLLIFYKYQIIDENQNIIFNQDWTINEKENIEIENEKYINKIYIKKIELNPIQQYKIIFYGKTNLGIEFELKNNICFYDLYPIVFPAIINLTNNYENGYIKINFIPFFNFNNSYEEDYFSNNKYYELYRTDEFSDFKNWEHIVNFKINQYSINNFYFNDYFISQGIKYKYGIKAVNHEGIKTQLLESDYIVADFEDMFLIDKELNLKIRYNPKISTYKTVKQENKIETLGNQYPYIIRNGLSKYKEMPISGLISFQMDDFNQVFNDNNNIIKDFYDTDLVGENIKKERLFKNYILDWLNNNQYKILKTPTEGNFIIQLMNINLTPVDSLGRMLHSFSATAYEVNDYNLENIKNYNIFQNVLEEESILKIESLNLMELEGSEGDYHVYVGYKIKTAQEQIIINFNPNFIQLEQLQFYGIEPNTKIDIIYKTGDASVMKSEIIIGRTRELIIQDAKNIISITIHSIFTNVTTQPGITYSWINKTTNLNYAFNTIARIEKIIDQELNNEDENMVFIETVNNFNQYIKIEKYNNLKTPIENLIFTKVDQPNNGNGFFIIGNSIFDNNNEKVKSYLFQPPIEEIKIPQSIRIYKEVKEFEDKNLLNFSFFVTSNNNDFELKENIKSNQFYIVPEFGDIIINNLDLIDKLWLGKNLKADISYLKYKIIRTAQG